MSIIETPIDGFEHKLKSTKLNYPQCTCNKCPRMYFNLLSIASRQSGKTYTICQLLKHYEENKLVDNNGAVHPIRIIIISPTIDANPIYKSLTSIDDKDIYDNYSDELLQDILDDIKKTKAEIDEYKIYVEIYKLVEKTPKNKIPKLLKNRPDILPILEKYDFMDYNDIDMKYKETPVNFIILDDILASNSFSNKKNSVLVNAVIKNRHMGVCFCILVQSCKGVTKTIRLNSSVFHLGKFANKKIILNDLYEECSNVLTEEQFEKLYTYATEDRYGSLIIDCSGGSKRFLKGLTTELSLPEIENIEDKKNIDNK